MIVSHVLLVLTILSIDLRISQATSRVIFQETTIADYHQHWMIQFSRVYSDELEFIENFNNKGNQSYKLGVNEFTDLTDDDIFKNALFIKRHWQYIVSNRGIASDQAYPYQVKDGACQSNVKPAMQIKGFNAVQQKTSVCCLRLYRDSPSRWGLLQGNSFIHYSSGVYNAGDCGTVMNHAVTLVGYGQARKESSIGGLRIHGVQLGERMVTLDFLEMWSGLKACVVSLSMLSFCLTS
ncbi:hypothetical protein YC2023_089858 [Brassica napus]